MNYKLTLDSTKLVDIDKRIFDDAFEISFDKMGSAIGVADAVVVCGSGGKNSLRDKVIPCCHLDNNNRVDWDRFEFDRFNAILADYGMKIEKVR